MRDPGTSSMSPLFRRVAACLLLVSGGSAYPERSADTPFILGVFPYLPASKLEQVYAPVAARFSEVLGEKVVLRSRPDFDRFREQVRQQAYDIILIQPFDYVRAAAPSGYIPVARWVASKDPADDGQLRAIFVVRADSGISGLQDLAGKTIATPHPDAAVSLLGRSVLTETKLDKKVRFSAVGNHTSCLQRLVVRKAAACVTAYPPLKNYRKRTGQLLTVIHESRSVPSSVYAVNESMPPRQRRLLAEEILSWNAESEKHRVYLHLGAWERLHAATDADYEPVRQIWNQLRTKAQ